MKLIKILKHKNFVVKIYKDENFPDFPFEYKVQKNRNIIKSRTSYSSIGCAIKEAKGDIWWEVGEKFKPRFYNGKFHAKY